tara:strand:+ start:3545 stop:5350 length:1806 start_codon:yes stop_codon:yes gene_type:complete
MMGKHIQEINQRKMDRVFEIVVKDRILVIEMFHQGNIVLCDDAYDIIQPLHFQRRKDRVVVPKVKYIFPASPEVEDYTSFKRRFQDDDSVSKILSAMGFAEYADEVLKISGVDGQREGDTLVKDDIDKLFDASEDILLRKETSPVIVNDNEEAISVVPFGMKMFSEYTSVNVESFNKALDTYFNEIKQPAPVQEPKPEPTIAVEPTPEHKIEREKSIVEHQEEAIEEYKEEEDETREEATLIYNNYGLVDNVLMTLRNARAKYSWDEIKDIITKEDSPEANAIIEIRESENRVIVNLDGNNVELFINKSPEENATYYFEHAKKFKRKIAKAEEQVEQRKESIAEMEDEVAPTFIADESEEDEEETEELTEDAPVVEKKKGRWYHKFRYFWSIEGLLVVAGKDATTNEELIKKHTEFDDVVLHADIHGAPFVVIKQRRDKRERVEDLTPQGVVEAAEFAASYSKAWQMGLGSVEVYWVKPDQVTKHAEPGQFLPKGSFVIRGQRNYMKSIKLRLAIGADIQNKSFIIAPLKSIASRCDYYVTIQPGETPAKEIAQRVKESLIEKALYPDEKDAIRLMPVEQIESRVPSAKASIMDRVESGVL